METQAAHAPQFNHSHMQRLKNLSHQQNHVMTATAASGSHKKAPTSDNGKATHPKYAVMIRDAIVLMKQRNGTSALAIAKSIETRHKSHLPSNFRKILTLQLRKLVRAGRLIKDKSRFRCTPSFKKNPEATPRARKAKTTKKKASRKAPRLKKAGRRRRKVVRRKRRRRGGNKKKKKQQRRSRSRGPAGSSRRRRPSRSPASSRGRKRKASSPARKKTRRASKSKSRSRSRKSSSRSKSTPRKRQATRRNRYYN